MGVLVLGALLMPAPADAAFPGKNGRIAFTSTRDGNFQIYSMNADGSGQTRLTVDPANPTIGSAWSPGGDQIASRCETAGDSYLCVMNGDGSGSHAVLFQDIAGADLSGPAWAPSGSRIVFSWDREFCDDTGDCSLQVDLGQVNANGTGVTTFSQPFTADFAPAWDPDGSRILYVRDGAIRTVRPDWTGDGALVPSGSSPDWSPDGSKIVFSRDTPYPNSEIFVVGADGSNEVRLTNNSVRDDLPAWSPDGSKIVFTSNEGGDNEIFLMNSDGSGRTPLTTNTAEDFTPDWQPIPINAYPRPKGATPMYISLVPAYAACASPNRQHGAPLAVQSCSPPAQTSAVATVGTLDANGNPAKSVGFADLRVKVGNPSTPADEADVNLQVQITDVRASNLSDYAGELQARPLLRITDKDNMPGPGGPGAATTEDTPFPFTVPCASTADGTVGATCSVLTTADGVLPGSVKEERRSNWQLQRFDLYDGGADGDADTSGDNTLFATQGVFVP